ncbi:MAG TPA: hypothetical protein VG096_20410 [Bryobacteraceae bacterium]|jgi:hypothetical protein|nr:hypothetical protein [Bryobacteraceae bacterium]
MRKLILSTQAAAVIVGVMSYIWIDTVTKTEVQFSNGSACPTTCSNEQPVIADPNLQAAIRFQELRKQWLAQRTRSVWVSDMVLCPAYQSIIGMGESAIPLILAQLHSEGNEPDHWFWALRSIVEFDPVKDEDRGDIGKMAASWLEWGREQGYAG